MKRRKGREYALQMLFEFDFTGRKPDRSFWEGTDADAETVAFARDIAEGAIKHIEEIDSVVGETAERWVMERMAAVDRNILRAATYELLYRKDIPAAVVINEAIEVAKKFSTSESASFINGILDRIAGRARR